MRKSVHLCILQLLHLLTHLRGNICNAFSTLSSSPSSRPTSKQTQIKNSKCKTTLHVTMTANRDKTMEDLVRTNTVQPPPLSPATNLPNQIYIWRSHQVRYQVAYPSNPNLPSKGSVILIHGLFVNSDHWRYTLKGLADAGYTAYAIDLLGSGYSSKPHPNDERSRKLVCGESNGRFKSEQETKKQGVTLGTANGGLRTGVEVDLLHPCKSPYNFFTWSEQVVDFTKDIILPAASSSNDKVTIVANSIGTITSLQSILDNPSLFDGAFIVNPNFRELHSAEVPLSNLAMPVIRQVQSILRARGQGLFNALAKPGTVKQILMEPYAIKEAVDEELIDVLLTPLLTPGASDVVFDTLSYSAGPLPEQQLREEHFPKDSVPIWVCYGSDDPWTPPARVESLSNIDTVKRVIRLDGVGHCPHDEAPEKVNPLLLEFLNDLKGG